MSPTRRTSITTGSLFVLATIAALAAAALDQTLNGTGYLAALANHPDRQTAAALCYLISAGASASIAIALYPLLKQVNPTLALGAVVFRTIEAVFYSTAVGALLSTQSLSEQVATTPADGRASIHVLADSYLSMRDHFNVAAIFAFGLGALMYYSVFYRSRLVPRWLSGWGVAGVLLIFTACLSALFSDSPVTGYTLLILPIAVQEIVLAAWLLVKGFNPTSSSLAESEAARTRRADRGGLVPRRPPGREDDW